ncbi:hypothetical protein CR513_31845, partial [Mucuna pruriens]
MRHKNEVFNIFRTFYTLVKTQFLAKIRILYSDNGGEYFNQEFLHYFQTYGIIHKTTFPQTPQKNVYLLNRIPCWLIQDSSSKCSPCMNPCLLFCYCLLVSLNVWPLYISIKINVWPCIFVIEKVYHCYHTTTKCIYVIMNVTILESKTYFCAPNMQFSFLEGDTKSRE